MIVVASVYHTGTNFVFQNLLKGMKQYGMGHSHLTDPPRSGFTRIHCDLDQSQYFDWWLQRCLCIVPLRHPISVAASWKARDRDLHNLAIQWKILKEKVNPFEPMYLPIDSPDRMNWLDTISRNINRELQTDWPVVMSCNKSAELTDDERESVFEVMSDGFFDRFGYEV